jgi:hypothetical protein
MFLDGSCVQPLRRVLRHANTRVARRPHDFAMLSYRRPGWRFTVAAESCDPSPSRQSAPQPIERGTASPIRWQLGRIRDVAAAIW